MLQDLSNPLVWHHLVFYPEDGEGGLLQASHGEKWLKALSDDLLTPKAIHPTTRTHYYIKELCQYWDGTWFIPMCWFSKKSTGMWATGYEVSKTNVCHHSF
jgi:hypothetical protein